MRHQTSVHLRPIWAMLCLLTYLFSATPLFPLSTAMAARMDGDHEVILSARKDGMRVVLSHDAHDPRKALTHSHCAMSRMLTLLADSPGPAHADHVLNFQNGNLAIPRESALCSTASSVNQTPATVAVGTTLALLPPLANVGTSLLALPRPALSVLVARATVLLI